MWEVKVVLLKRKWKKGGREGEKLHRPWMLVLTTEREVSHTTTGTNGNWNKNING